MSLQWLGLFVSLAAVCCALCLLIPFLRKCFAKKGTRGHRKKHAYRRLPTQEKERDYAEPQNASKDLALPNWQGAPENHVMLAQPLGIDQRAVVMPQQQTQQPWHWRLKRVTKSMSQSGPPVVDVWEAPAWQPEAAAKAAGLPCPHASPPYIPPTNAMSMPCHPPQSRPLFYHPSTRMGGDSCVANSGLKPCHPSQNRPLVCHLPGSVSPTTDRTSPPAAASTTDRNSARQGSCHCPPAGKVPRVLHKPSGSSPRRDNLRSVVDSRKGSRSKSPTSGRAPSRGRSPRAKTPIEVVPKLSPPPSGNQRPKWQR